MPLAFWIFWLVGLSISTFLGAWVVKRHRDVYGWGILSLFLGLYILSANILVPRLFNFHIGGLQAVFTTGSVIWPFTSQLTDMINEVYGRKKAYVSAALAYLGNLMFISFAYMGMQVAGLWDTQQESWWVAYFSQAPRIFLASFVAYFTENTFDIWFFSLLKKKFWKAETGGSIEMAAKDGYTPPTSSLSRIIGFVTLRSSGSDTLAMVIDSVVFTVLAFAGTLPNNILITMIFSNMAVKAILANFDIPFFVLFRTMIRGVRREF